MTPLVEYYPNSWIDLTAEAVMGTTKESCSSNTYEVSPRLGIRFHLFGNLRQYVQDGIPFRLERFSLATLLRYEYRSLFYDDGSSEHQSRFRVRFETKMALNHTDHAADDTYYIFTDAEQYFNIGKNLKEAFLNKSRLRLGPGYTYTRNNRFELLVIYDYAYNTFSSEARHDAAAINLRYKHFF